MKSIDSGYTHGATVGTVAPSSGVVVRHCRQTLLSNTVVRHLCVSTNHPCGRIATVHSHRDFALAASDPSPQTVHGQTGIDAPTVATKNLSRRHAQDEVWSVAFNMVDQKTPERHENQYHERRLTSLVSWEGVSGATVTQPLTAILLYLYTPSHNTKFSPSRSPRRRKPSLHQRFSSSITRRFGDRNGANDNQTTNDQANTNEVSKRRAAADARDHVRQCCWSEGTPHAHVLHQACPSISVCVCRLRPMFLVGNRLAH